MTPLAFEARYGADWDELGALIARVRATAKTRRADADFPADRLAQLYRRACEQLALARARDYPPYLVDRLEALTHDGHQIVYQWRDYGWRRLLYLVTDEFPRAVRAHAIYVWVAAAAFVLPLAAIGLLVHARPELILSVVDAQTAAEFESMYSTSAESIGRRRSVDTDWQMLGFYIRNNVSVAFQCFAGGMFAGIGSLFFLAFNGALIGAVAGYLTERGLSETFYGFVATHSSFELTAIVLSGAAGLRIGHAVLSPGRRSRLDALGVAAREAIVIVYGVAGMLIIAAVIEAFWSSSATIPAGVKYGVAAICWAGVLGYLLRQGRGRGAADGNSLPTATRRAP
jgi:uncharacterized membrane protein SpoIIM required for sporulation